MSDLKSEASHSDMALGEKDAALDGASDSRQYERAGEFFSDIWLLNEFQLADSITD